MRRSREQEPNTQEISQYEFEMFVNQLLEESIAKLNNLNAILKDIQIAKANGYRIEYFLLEDGTPAYKKIKKPQMGFNTK